MAQNIEDFLPPLQNAGLNTAENITASGTNTFSGSTTISGAATISGGLTVSSSTVSITTTTTSSTGVYVALSGTTTGVTGGYITPGLSVGSNVIPLGWYTGAGAPTIGASEGSIYTNVKAGANDTLLYLRTSTTWISLQRTA